MKVTDILVRDASLLQLEAADKDQVLTEMAKSLGVAEPSVDAESLLAVLRDREELQSTGIGDGVAIPHGKLPGLDRLLASFARSPGVEFAAIDGQPTRLFFLLVVPEHSGGQHLKALARISRFLRDESFREKLIAAVGLDEVFAAIEEEDAKF
jgi:PTS system nitrogen regulatory IIA component